MLLEHGNEGNKIRIFLSLSSSVLFVSFVVIVYRFMSHNIKCLLENEI